MENFNDLQQRDLSQRRDLNQNNRQFMDRSLLDLLNNRENRGASYDLARGGWRNSLDLEGLRGRNESGRQAEQNSWQSGESSKDRDLQKELAQLSQNGSNWRDSLSQLFNIPGLFGGGAGGGGWFGGGGGGTGGIPNFGTGGSGTTTQAPSSAGGGSSYDLNNLTDAQKRRMNFINLSGGF
jgi:hypothetical protein